ncbi:MAG: glycine cleavage system aminomethyltransferase GcvT [bacterium]|nr:glycine cleavage system aminomethyltransferase GcvT [bacterium]
MLKKTAFFNKHVEAGGKIVPFAGFEMPIQYKGITQEVNRVRTTVGVFDVAHMGRVEVSGEKALDFINEISTNDASKLELFQAQYSAMCYPDGGIVDDILVYKLEGKWWIVINAANKDKDIKWMLEHKPADVKFVDLSDEITQLAIQGPKTEAVLQPLSNIDLSKIGYYRSAHGTIAGIPTFIARTGYTGEDGFELYFPANFGIKMWDELMKAGKKFEIEPIGLGARDLLRLEMKYTLYGNDISQYTNPLEAGLGWITKLDKPKFVGKEVLLEKKSKGLATKLIAFTMAGIAIPRQHYKIRTPNGEEIGEVTSGNFSPSIKKGIGLGYIKLAYTNPGTKIEVDCRGKFEPAEVVTPPFYKNASHK